MGVYHKMMIIIIGERTSKRGRDKNDFRQNMYPYENMKFLLSVLNKKNFFRDYDFRDNAKTKIINM